MEYNFGVEVEFYTSVSMASATQALVDAGFDARLVSYSSTVNDYWGIKPDGSVPGGMELVTPILTGDEGRAALLRAMEVIRRLPRARVTSRCGVHVHLSPAGRTFTVDEVSKIARRWVNFEDTFDLLQPQSRRSNNNTYCRSNAYQQATTYAEASRNLWRRLRYVTTTSQIAAVVSPSRYYKLNLQSLSRHGSIEYRHSAGSIDPRKIDMWVRFLMAFTDTACAQTRLWRRKVDAEESVADRFRKLSRGMPTDVRQFYVRRIRALNSGLDFQSAV